MRSVIFDLDGTLLDTFPGIMESANDVAEMLGYERCEDRILFKPFTGLPLSVGFPTVFHMGPEDAAKAPKMFIERYEEAGCLVYDYYPGMVEVVKELSRRGVRLGVSTLKTEDAAKRMLGSSGYEGLFESIRGNTPEDDAVKSLLIGTVLTELGSSREESVFVGDTVGDLIGAEKAGVPFIGVSWGFGSRELAERCRCMETPVELEKKIEEFTA